MRLGDAISWLQALDINWGYLTDDMKLGEVEHTVLPNPPSLSPSDSLDEKNERKVEVAKLMKKLAVPVATGRAEEVEDLFQPENSPRRAQKLWPWLGVITGYSQDYLKEATFIKKHWGEGVALYSPYYLASEG